MTTNQKLAIGIDLGTTYSCVGILQGSNVNIIANGQGNRTTPSYVAFTDTERLVGDSAKNQAAMNPENTLFGVKRLIGRKFTDASVQDDIKSWPFKVSSTIDNKPVIEIMYKGEKKEFSPEEISSMILVSMKNIAEEFLGQEVKDAVITVPAYFNDSQRQSTKDAGVIAGLNVLRIINEPTASAIAYGLNINKNGGEKNILIFDMGGGTHDVSLLSIDDGVFEVKATSGDVHLGGEDIDNALVEHFKTEFQRKHKKNIDSHRSILRLRTACERLKRVLSTSATASIEIDSLFDGVDFSSVLSRAKFNDLCKPFFSRAIEPVRKVLLDSKMSKDKIDEIVLVGGSSRIPKIQEMLKDFFNGKELCKNINPDEAIAQGAAIQASILVGNKNDVTNDLLLIDVTPLSLGIETSGSIMTNIIDRNCTIPCSKKKTFSTFQDNQTIVDIKIFEGERAQTQHNNLLGNFQLTGIPLMPRGRPEIEVEFNLDANGILVVSASEKSSGNVQKIEIKNDTGRFSKEKIQQMVDDAEKFKKDDDMIREKIGAKNDLESYIYSVKTTIEQESKFTDTDKKDIQSKIDEIQNNMDTYTFQDYQSKKHELEEMCNSKQQKNSNSGETKNQPENNGPKIEEVD